jgi:hypothetical protein
MFNHATEVIQTHGAAGNPYAWVIPLIAFILAWCVFLVIRGFCCWFWRTTAIVNELKAVVSILGSLVTICAHCQNELSRLDSKLERIAKSDSGATSNKTSGPAGT